MAFYSRRNHIASLLSYSMDQNSHKSQASFQGKAPLLDGRMTKNMWTYFKTVTLRLGEREK